ncbi:unnamed protein product [Amoebophrya sp. A120]|nr:unnamed protein product [Amoebophrya sp. A120]|eukprot:GSA120T00019512001.1
MTGYQRGHPHSASLGSGGGTNVGSFSQLLGDQGMENYDKDVRFMAASDLTQQITTQQNQPLEVNMQKRISNAFLHQLEDASIEVQGNAVKCLAKIVCKFQEPLIGEAAGRLAHLVLEGNEKVRDIYATCLKGLLLELNPQTSGQVVCQNVLPRMLSGILSANFKAEVKEECLDVLCEVLRRFGDSSRVHAEKMTPGLLNLLQSPVTKLSIRKKCAQCFGILSTVLLENQLEALLITFLNLTKPKPDNGNGGSSQTPESLLADRMLCLQSIAAIGKNACNPRVFARHIPEIIPLFLQICRENTINLNHDHSSSSSQLSAKHSTEIVENCLLTFQAFCSWNNGSGMKEMAEPEFFEPILELVLDLIAYDPNYYGGGDEDEDMGGSGGDSDYSDQSEYDSDEEDDQESWKVRRAAFKLATAMITGLPFKLETILEKFANPCIQRFTNERDANVKLDAFCTIECLAKVTCSFHQSGGAVSGGLRGGASTIGTRQPTNESTFLSGLHPEMAGAMNNMLVQLPGNFLPPSRTPTGQSSDGGGAPASSTSGGGTNSTTTPGAMKRTASAIKTESLQKFVGLIPKTLVPALAKQLNGKSKQGAFQLLKTLSQLLPTQLEQPLLANSNSSITANFLSGLTPATSDSISVQILLDTLIILKNLISHYVDAAVYLKLSSDILPKLFKLISANERSKQEYRGYKAVAEALRVVSVYLYPLLLSNLTKSGNDQSGDAIMGDSDSLAKSRTIIQPLFPILQEKLQKTDLDQDVKEASLDCFAHALACTGDSFLEEAGKCLPAFVERMRNELTRMRAMLALKVICSSHLEVTVSEDLLHQMCTFLVNYLAQNQRAIRQQALDCLGALLRKYKNLPEKTQLLCVSATSAFFTDTDLYLTDLAVQVVINSLNSTTGGSVAVSEVIAQKCLPNILNCTRSPLLQGGALVSILTFLNTISYQEEEVGTNGQPAKKTKLTGVTSSAANSNSSPVGSMLCLYTNSTTQQASHSNSVYRQLTLVEPVIERAPTTQAARNTIANLAKCVAALAIVSPHLHEIVLENCANLTEIGSTSADHQTADEVTKFQTELALLSLGEIGKHVDLTTIANNQSQQGCKMSIQELLLSFLNSEDDEITHAAALTLGYSCMGGQSTFLTLLVDCIIRETENLSSSSVVSATTRKKQYLLLTGFREVISMECENSNVVGAAVGVHPSSNVAGGVVSSANNSAPNITSSTSSSSKIVELLQENDGFLRKKICAILENSLAKSTEEGVRVIAAECLGFLIHLLDHSSTSSAGGAVGDQLVLATVLRMMGNGECAKTRACAVSAVRYAHSKRQTVQLSNNQQQVEAANNQQPKKQLMQPFINALEDPDVLHVRKAVLQSISAILHSNPVCLSPNVIDYVARRCNDEGKVKLEFIREVDLGPFKHKVDDGIPVRKSAFVVLLDLLQTFPQEMVPMAEEGQILELLANGFQDSDDIQVLACSLLAEAANSFWLGPTFGTGITPIAAQQGAPNAMLSNPNNPMNNTSAATFNFIEPLERAIQKNIKIIQSKQQNSMQKAQDMLRCFVRCLRQIFNFSNGNEQTVTLRDANKNFIDFFARLQRDPIFLQYWEICAKENQANGAA